MVGKLARTTMNHTIEAMKLVVALGTTMHIEVTSTMRLVAFSAGNSAKAKYNSCFECQQYNLQ